MRYSISIKQILIVIAVCLCMLCMHVFHLFRFLPWIDLAQEARSHADAHQVTYVDFLTVLLTALGVMLAVVALGIGALAIWGYTGLRESLTNSLSERADEALQKKLKQYPGAAEMTALRERVDEVERIHRLMVNTMPMSAADAPEKVHDNLRGDADPLKVKDYPPDLGL